FWAVHQMNSAAQIVPPNINTMNFVMMSSNSVDADRAEASSAPQQEAPKPKPQQKKPEPKAEPKIKPVVKKDAKPDVKAEPKTPDPKPKTPEPQKTTPAETQPSKTVDSSTNTNLAANSTKPGSSNSNTSSNNSSQGSVTQPTHSGGHLNNPQPPYPTQSLEAEEEGSVGLRVKVEANGRPSNVELAKSSGYPRLDRSALKTVREKYRFTPATQNGQPIPYTYTFSIRFNIPRR
ncbi:MAG: energy transducer TonB, partial [Neisseriaceae bacterium]|nr:energy transducer TonB [Neisseriaceae bacterium]